MDRSIVEAESIAYMGDIVGGAIKRHLGLDIEYTDAKGDTTERAILPFYLVQDRTGMVYIHAYCAKRNARRSFRLDRVKNIGLREKVVDKDRMAKIAKANSIIPPMGQILAGFSNE